MYELVKKSNSSSFSPWSLGILNFHPCPTTWQWLGCYMKFLSLVKEGLTEHRRKNGNIFFSSCGLSDGRQTLVPVLWFGHILSLFLYFCLYGAGMTIHLAAALCSRKRQKEWLLLQHVCARICLNPYAVITGNKHCGLFPWKIRQRGPPSHLPHLQIKLGSS